MSDPVKLTVIPGIKSDTAASPGPVPNAKDVADAGAVLPQVDASLTDSSPIATNPAVSRDGVDQAATVGTPEMRSEAVNAEGTQKAVQSIDGSGLTVGQHLAAVRSALGLSIEHIADQLKLSPRQIDAIETGNYAALPDLARSKETRCAVPVLPQISIPVRCAEAPVPPSFTTPHIPDTTVAIFSAWNSS